MEENIFARGLSLSFFGGQIEIWKTCNFTPRDVHKIINVELHRQRSTGIKKKRKKNIEKKKNIRTRRHV